MSYEYLIEQLFEALLHTILFLFVAISLITIYLRTHNKQINWQYLVQKHWAILFAGFYYLLILRITCFSRIHYQGINLRLFSSYEDAWFNGDEQAWQQLLLNLTMFVPLGMLLPVVHRFFKRWYVSLITLFLGSLLIETIQFIFHLGVFEVDDLLNNTLGGILGFCFIMMVLMGGKKRLKAMTVYAILPFLSLVMTLVISYMYWSKPYGNLSCSVFRPYPMNHTEFTYRDNLAENWPMIGMYRIRKPNSKQIHTLIRALEIKLKLQGQPLINDNAQQQVRSYLNGQLIIHNQSGSWSYRRVTNQEAHNNNREQAKTAGEKLGLIDAEAKLKKQRSETLATWEWKLDGIHNGKKGILTIACGEDGIMNAIDYDVNQYTFVRKEKAISPKKAFSKLERGEFRTQSSIPKKKIVFDHTTLAYQLDSKDYLQPVYLFSGESGKNDCEILIPALP